MKKILILSIIAFYVSISHAQKDNLGIGQFGNETEFIWGGYACGDPFTGDFNGDGFCDIGVFNPNCKSGWFIQYNLGKGHKGQFGNQTEFIWGEHYGNKKPFTGDFNGDGLCDIGFYHPNKKSGWWIKYNLGNGEFGNETEFIWGDYGCGEPITGDFNGDGFCDIGVYHPNCKSGWFIQYNLGKGHKGQFGNETEFIWGGYAFGDPITGDFNGDRSCDIGVFNPNGKDRWWIKYNLGKSQKGQFGNATEFIWGEHYGSNKPFTGDFNGDGLCDIGFYHPNEKSGWWIKYNNPEDQQNPCFGGEIKLGTSSADFYKQLASIKNLRELFCVSSSAPKNAPSYKGQELAAYKYISKMLYPGSKGDIRHLYNSVTIDLGGLPNPNYSDSCNCGGENIFDAVSSEIQKEIQAIADIRTLFSSITINFINPLFIEKNSIVAAVVGDFSLPTDTNVSINTGAVIENTISAAFIAAAKMKAGGISPWAPILISALFNLSRNQNDGTIPNNMTIEFDKLENQLSKTFKNILTQKANLMSEILSDYSIYMKLGLHVSSPITDIQLNSLFSAASYAYKRQLYSDLIPFAYRIVVYDPSDSHLGGGGKVYGQNASYSKPNHKDNSIISYEHYAGFAWNDKSYFHFRQQLLTTNQDFNAGDFATGKIVGYRPLNSKMCITIFDDMKFTYNELLSLRGMHTYYQCSLCTDCGGNNFKYCGKTTQD